jgi:hypothetical protein
MRRLFWFLVAATASAEVVDRIAVAIGSQIVTDSAIRRQLAFDGFLQRTAPDLSPAARRRAAGNLVNQALILREMELLRYPRPDVPEAAKAVEELRRSRSQDENSFRADLARYGFSEDDLLEEIIWQLTLQRFVTFRFRPGVQVSDEEVAALFDKEFKSSAQPGQDLGTMRDALTRLVAERKLTETLAAWLDQTRKSTRIRFYEEAFQ